MTHRLKLLLPLLLLAAGAGLWLLRPESSRREQRMAAQGRWEAQRLGNYRIALELTRQDEHCFQEFVVREGQVATLLRSTCSLAGIGLATVERLFTLAERVEGPPYCYPSPSLCACQRVNVGKVVFHPTQGYPQELTMRREIRPNLLHADYWRWSWATRDLGVCRSVPLSIHIRVLSLSPLP